MEAIVRSRLSDDVGGAEIDRGLVLEYVFGSGFKGHCATRKGRNAILLAIVYKPREILVPVTPLVITNNAKAVIYGRVISPAADDYRGIPGIVVCLIDHPRIGR